MFHQHSNGSTTLPRGFRFHHEEGPTTPEPADHEELRQPSPPRQRLKVRRRNASSLQAPTEQFLASVAAADVPIPTIEVAQDPGEDMVMSDREEMTLDTTGLLPPRRFSPPKTPVPQISMDEVSKRPDWSMGTPSPSEDYFTRPTSSHSNASSEDSFYSGSRFSRPSEDGSCTSPESDAEDPFQFPIEKGKGRAIVVPASAYLQSTPLNNKLRSKTRKDAPWTKAQSAHLWATYNLYLQDPTVTPFRIGASIVPPEGVCHRVAREARRSWKGAKTPLVRRESRLTVASRGSDKSGSNTPTAETPKVYAPWPHSSSATRNHLRDLCRKTGPSAARSRHLQSRSPTPFTRQEYFPLPIPSNRSAFNTQDIALSLATSTADSLQPGGPLAQLHEEKTETVKSSLLSLEQFKPMNFGESRGLSLNESRGRRLGSPFARTYGPSSSKTLDRRPSPPRHAISGPHLGSPLDFNQARSLNGTQKRRAQHDLEEELSPNGAIVRPSILNEQLFGSTPNQRRVRSRGFSLGDEALRGCVPGAFQPSTFTLPPPKITLQPAPMAPPRLLPSAIFDAPPARLGSPFSESGPSNTFPRRLFHDPQATVRKSSFATMHQTRRSIESFDFGEGPSLQSRLEQLDNKLKQIREREEASKSQPQ